MRTTNILSHTVSSFRLSFLCLGHVVLFVALAFGISHHAEASAEFEFDDLGGLDGQGICASISATDLITGDTVDLPRVEIQGQDGTLVSAGAAHLTNALSGTSGDGGAEIENVEVTIPVALRSNRRIFVRVIAF